jgi:putative endonuclease
MEGVSMGIHPSYYVYIMTNKYNNVLYIGVTNNLERRMIEHCSNQSRFTARYQIHKLVYYEAFSQISDAIQREKQIKGGSRQNKMDLINSTNPEWNDLLEDE